MTQKTPCLTQNNTTLTQRKPTRSLQTRKEDHTSIFTILRQKNVKHHPPQKITILSPVYIKEYQCTNMYIKKNNNYMNYIFIISSINTHTPIYKKIIYNISYKMLIKKNKTPATTHPHRGVCWRSRDKKTIIHNHPKKHTNHTPTNPSGFILS